MEINKTENTNIIKFKPSPKSVTKKKNTSDAKAQATFKNYATPSNPKYYQALKNIDFSRHFTIREKRDKNGKISSIDIKIRYGMQDLIKLTFDRSDKLNALLDLEGEIDLGAAGFFVDYFKTFYAERKEKFEADKNYLLYAIKEAKKPKIRLYQAQDETESKEKAPEYEGIAKDVLDNLSDQSAKLYYAQKMLNETEENFKYAPITSAKEALILLALCKKEDGSADTSNIDKKSQIAVYITNYSQIHGTDCFDRIIEASKDKDGNLDIDFCHALSRILQAGTYSEDFENEINQAKAIVSKYKPMSEFKTIIDNIVKLLQDNEIFLYMI